MLCLVDLLEIKITRHGENIGDKGQSPYIVEFFIPRGQYEVQHLKTKKCNIWCLASGLLILSLTNNEPKHIFYVKLGKDSSL